MFLSLITILLGEPLDSIRKIPKPDIHFQQTVVVQYKPTIYSEYSDKNSLIAKSEHQETVTSTLYFNQTYKRFTLRLHPEVSGGSGLSSALGVAGFPNGEAFRVGSASATLYMARMLMEYSHKSWFMMAGKFSQTDYLSQGSFSNNARMQFLNWSLMAPGAWDYGANTRGYTGGVLVRKSWGRHCLQGAMVLVPTKANGPELSWDIKKNRQVSVEYSYQFGKQGREGIFSILLYSTRANMGNYKLAVQKAYEGNYYPTLDSARSENRNTKRGIALYFEKYLAKGLGIFARASFNDGMNESWAFTEIDQSLAFGLSWQDLGKKNLMDEVGMAVVANGISRTHRRYLSTGGYGFLLGDGALDFGPEVILECYARIPFFRPEVTLSPDYQFIVNPGYNQARGPVHVLGFRAHVEF